MSSTPVANGEIRGSFTALRQHDALDRDELFVPDPEDFVHMCKRKPGE